MAKIINKSLIIDAVKPSSDGVKILSDGVKIVLDKADSRMTETKPTEVDSQVNECVEDSIWEKDKMYLKICQKWCQC